MVVDGVPAGLGVSGREFWVSVLAGRELDAASRALLLNACRIVDRLDDLTRELGGRELTSFNAKGDEVINPLVSEHRQQYATLATVLGRMGLGQIPKVRKSGKSSRDQLAGRREARLKASG